MYRGLGLLGEASRLKSFRHLAAFVFQAPYRTPFLRAFAEVELSLRRPYTTAGVIYVSFHVSKVHSFREAVVNRGDEQCKIFLKFQKNSCRDLVDQPHHSHCGFLGYCMVLKGNPCTPKT